MISLNPFKKKEDDGFKLDEYSLPSLSEDSSPNSNVSGSELPSLGESNAFSNSMDNNNSFSPQNNTSFDSVPSQNIDNSQDVPGITNSLPSSFNPTPVESHIQEEKSQNTSDSSLHQDLVKARMETVATKIELMEARQHSIEQKLEQIYQMLAMEVSPETKKRLKIKSMMDSIKDS